MKMIKSLNFVIQNFLNDNKFNLSQEIKNILIERSKGDRINLINELIKLKNLQISKKIKYRGCFKAFKSCRKLQCIRIIR